MKLIDSEYAIIDAIISTFSQNFMRAVLVKKEDEDYPRVRSSREVDVAFDVLKERMSVLLPDFSSQLEVLIKTLKDDLAYVAPEMRDLAKPFLDFREQVVHAGVTVQAPIRLSSAYEKGA